MDGTFLTDLVQDKPKKTAGGFQALFLFSWLFPQEQPSTPGRHEISVAGNLFSKRNALFTGKVVISI